MARQPFIKKLKPFLLKLHIFSVLVFVYFFINDIYDFLLNSVNKLAKKTIPILLYHRVDKISHDPIILAVTPETFEEHLKYINKFYHPISLSKLIERLQAGSVQGNEICVTFDDGYRDNLINALPILEKYNTPATIFITTYRLGLQSSFDFDNQYNNNERGHFLSASEIKVLSEHPLIEIGAHTHKHSKLSSLPEGEQKLEIETGKKILESIIGKRVLYFAYPFGSRRDFNKKTRQIVKELGFIFAYTNTGLLGTISSDPYSFPRINIRNCSVKKLSQKLCNY